MSIKRICCFVASTLLLMGGVAWGQHSPFRVGEWLRLSVETEGVHRLTVADVPMLGGARVDSIALFGLRGGLLSEFNADTLPAGLRQCAVWINDADGDGLFGSADELFFYAQPASLWEYSGADGRYHYTVSPYETRGYYFITPSYGGATQRVATATTPAGSRADCRTYTALTCINQESVNIYNTGQLWVGDVFNSSVSQRSYRLSFESSLPSGTAVQAQIGVVSTAGDATFTMSGGGTLTAQCGRFFPYAKGGGVLTWSGGNTMQFTVGFSAAAAGGSGYMDYIELSAEAKLEYASKPLIAREPPAGGLVRYVVAGATSGLRVWDVSDPCVPQELAVEHDGGEAFFVSDASRHRTFAIFGSTGLKQVVQTESVANQDIAGSEGAELVVVANPALREQAERLARLHRDYDNMSVMVVTADEVYNEYSAGRQDPMAIRNMMRQRYEAALADPSNAMPRYLLLFGRGTYDNRNLQGKSACHVVTYQSAESVDDEGSSYSTDDIYGYLEPSESGRADESLDIGIGRLPAKSLQEATAIVDKLEQYITKGDLLEDASKGDWRNSIALLADDADPSRGGDTSFTHSSEYTANEILSRYPQYNIDKIFADAYVQQSGASGSYYPDVNNAVNSRFNYGCLIFNYVGHGSPRYIGTEHYIDLVDISRFTNYGRLPFFVASTCSYGRFDNPDEQCGAEELLLARGGAIGVMAATRPISHSQRFNTNLIVNALNPSLRLGDALRLAKNDMPVAASICLLADPALRLALPEAEVRVTAINSRSVDVSRADSAMVLSQLTVEGVVVDHSGALLTDFNGSIYPVVYDRKTKATTLANDNPGHGVDFTQQKGVIYKGRHAVSGGRFSYTFTVPRDVAYNYDYGKLSHYAVSADGKTDATGQYGNILFGGFNQDADLQVAPPSLQLWMNDTLFVDGGTVGNSPTLIAYLADEVGINAFGSGLGHDITAMLDGNPNDLLILNDFYTPDVENFTNGKLSYTFHNLAPGRHTLTLKAWNIYNYSATATISFNVRGGNLTDSNIVSRFFAYPNPASSYARLQIEHAAPDSVVHAAVYIYNAMGQHVRTLQGIPPKGGYVAGPLTWDLAGAAGATVAPGIYMARAVLRHSNGREYTATTKIVVRK